LIIAQAVLSDITINIRGTVN